MHKPASAFAFGIACLGIPYSLTPRGDTLTARTHTHIRHGAPRRSQNRYTGHATAPTSARPPEQTRAPPPLPFSESVPGYRGGGKREPESRQNLPRTGTGLNPKAHETKPDRPTTTDTPQRGGRRAGGKRNLKPVRSRQRAHCLTTAMTAAREKASRENNKSAQSARGKNTTANTSVRVANRALRSLRSRYHLGHAGGVIAPQRLTRAAASPPGATKRIWASPRITI
jgi:hypothetical protein